MFPKKQNKARVIKVTTWLPFQNTHKHTRKGTKKWSNVSNDGISVHRTHFIQRVLTVCSCFGRLSRLRGTNSAPDLEVTAHTLLTLPDSHARWWGSTQSLNQQSHFNGMPRPGVGIKLNYNILLWTLEQHKSWNSAPGSILRDALFPLVS